MIEFQLDETSGVATYLQLVQQVHQALRMGMLEPGDRLPTAQQVVAQSQDRFAAGVTNNVEVIQAQQQLASANDQYISSAFAHNIAKVLLARSIGNAEQMVKQYLAGNPALPPAVIAPSAQPAVPDNKPPATPNPPQAQ